MPAYQERDRDRPDVLTVADDDLAEFALQRPLECGDRRTS
jgi:hypothetical protein